MDGRTKTIHEVDRIEQSKVNVHGLHPFYLISVLDRPLIIGTISLWIIGIENRNANFIIDSQGSVGFSKFFHAEAKLRKSGERTRT
jgi:hypothetical protein